MLTSSSVRLIGEQLAADPYANANLTIKLLDAIDHKDEVYS